MDRKIVPRELLRVYGQLTGMIANASTTRVQPGMVLEFNRLVMLSDPRHSKTKHSPLFFSVPVEKGSARPNRPDQLTDVSPDVYRQRIEELKALIMEMLPEDVVDGLSVS